MLIVPQRASLLEVANRGRTLNEAADSNDRAFRTGVFQAERRWRFGIVNSCAALALAHAREVGQAGKRIDSDLAPFIDENGQETEWLLRSNLELDRDVRDIDTNDVPFRAINLAGIEFVDSSGQPDPYHGAIRVARIDVQLIPDEMLARQTRTIRDMFDLEYLLKMFPPTSGTVPPTS